MGCRFSRENYCHSLSCCFCLKPPEASAWIAGVGMVWVGFASMFDFVVANFPDEGCEHCLDYTFNSQLSYASGIINAVQWIVSVLLLIGVKKEVNFLLVLWLTWAVVSLVMQGVWVAVTIPFTPTVRGLTSFIHLIWGIHYFIVIKTQYTMMALTFTPPEEWLPPAPPNSPTRKHKRRKLRVNKAFQPTIRRLLGAAVKLQHLYQENLSGDQCNIERVGANIVITVDDYGDGDPTVTGGGEGGGNIEGGGGRTGVVRINEERVEEEGETNNMGHKPLQGEVETSQNNLVLDEIEMVVSESSEMKKKRRKRRVDPQEESVEDQRPEQANEGHTRVDESSEDLEKKTSRRRKRREREGTDVEGRKNREQKDVKRKTRNKGHDARVNSSYEAHKTSGHMIVHIESEDPHLRAPSVGIMSGMFGGSGGISRLSTSEEETVCMEPGGAPEVTLRHTHTKAHWSTEMRDPAKRSFSRYYSEPGEVIAHTGASTSSLSTLVQSFKPLKYLRSNSTPVAPAKTCSFALEDAKKEEKLKDGETNESMERGEIPEGVKRRHGSARPKSYKLAVGLDEHEFGNGSDII